MRLIGTFQNESDLRRFSEYLKRKKIDHSIEEEKVSDWGSDDYGTVRWLLWVFDEDTFESVYDRYNQFKQNPDDPIFPKEDEPVTPPLKKEVFPSESLLKKVEFQENKIRKEPYGKVTLFLLLLCSFLYFMGSFLEPQLKNSSKSVAVPIFLSPINKVLMFDFPDAWKYYDELILKYGTDALVEPSSLPTDGRILFQEANTTPYWKGAYDGILTFLKGRDARAELESAPLFVKIREGEFWRLFTPALLHFDLFHLFFNMIWLLVLGRQIESRIGVFKYSLLILLTGILSNVSQYLMTGPSFIGFSGVVCAFIGFVYARQQKASWEGYQLQRSTFLFVLIFVFGIAAVQFLAFILEALSVTNYSPPIASTAHIVGMIAGYVLGRLKFFSWETGIKQA